MSAPAQESTAISRRARLAVAMAFASSGFAIATVMSRVPAVRDALALSPAALGMLLVAISAGSLLALPTAGGLVRRAGPGHVVAVAAAVAGAGLATVGVGADLVGSRLVTAVGLFALGLGSGAWDVAMNVEGAVVERAVGRTVMPHLHAAFSLGTVAGAAVGSAAAAVGIATGWHVLAAGAVVAVVPACASCLFLPVGAGPEHAAHPRRRSVSAWTERRTLVLGVMVLAVALAEGTAHDWLALALVDGHGVAPWLGAAAFALFLAAETVGRLSGGRLLDRYGRGPMLWVTFTLAVAGVVLVVVGTGMPVVLLGVVLWGIGVSLGFPVGMSAAADEPSGAPARVGVVSTIGYTAFLAGPPLVGALGSHVGPLLALLVVAGVVLLGAAAVPATRTPPPGTEVL